MSDYTPDDKAVLEAYRFHVRTIDNARYSKSGRESMTGEEITAEFNRFTAKVKADALREFGSSLIRNSDPETDQRVFDPWDVDSLATNRADRIEGEA